MHKIVHYVFVTLFQIKWNAWPQAYENNWLQIYVFLDSMVEVEIEIY